MHRLLSRQIAKHISDFDALDAELKRLLEAVDQTYVQADNDRLLLERSLDLSSEELMERNQKLSYQLVQIEFTQEKLRQNQMQLAHVVRLSTMGELATGIAHELNQPLAAIVAYIEGSLRRIRAGESLSNEIVSALEKAAEQSQRAGEIIRRIREFIRKGEYRTEAIDVNVPVRDAVGLLENDAVANDVQISLRLANTLPPVFADVVQIQQVVLNLCRNGIDALRTIDDRDRKLDVRTAASDNDRVVIAVCDNGAGLTAEARAKMFTPFFTTKRDGLGMGLAICQTIAEIHRGELRFNASHGGGTEFSLSLPAWRGDMPASR
jgi:C4-dicarboxylate-specific signal transduction histidine kinase